MRKTFLNTAVALALCACGGDGGGLTGPSTPDITGTFLGDCTVSIDTVVVYQAVLELVQSADSVSGTLALTATANRLANLSGSVSGTRLIGMFTFTGSCPGTASVAADIANDGTRLTGSYSASDCYGSYSGAFSLDKQEGPIPALVTATGPYPAHLTIKNGRLFWSEGGEDPIRAISLGGGSPVVLAHRIGPPEGVTVWGQDVFWLEEQSGTSVSGCTGAGVIRLLKKTSISDYKTSLLATGDDCANATTDLVVDGTHVYWVTSSVTPNTYALRRTPVSGGLSTIVTTTGAPIVAVTEHSGHLYWMENFFPDPAGAIRRVPISGGSPVTLVSGITSRTRSFAVNSAALFYAEANFPSSDNLIEVPLDGGSPIQLGTVANTPKKLVADGTNLYWIDDVSVSALSLSGGSPTVLADAANTPLDLIARASDVLWSETTGPAHGETGAVKGVPKSGGPVFVLAQGGDAPRRLAVDASWVYWTEGGPFGLIEAFGRVARVPANGGAVETVVAGVNSDVPPITVSDTYVFVADGFRIKRIPVLGGPIETVAEGDFYITSLVTDGVHVYWVEDPLSTVRKTPVSGGAVTTLASGSGPAGTIRLDATHVYWLDHEDLIRRVPKEGGNPVTVLGSVPGLLTDFVVDGANLYFSEWDGGRIGKTPVTGGEVSTLATLRPDQTRRLTTDGLSVYWIDLVDIGKVTTTGEGPSFVSRVRASDPFFAASIVLDASNIYWTEVPISQIWRVQK